MDDFEQRLKRQPLRQVPADWRREILAAARSAQPPHPASRGPHRSLLSTLNHQLSTLLWPHPKAWGALAAIWILIFAVNFSMPDETPAMAQKASPPAPETVSELRQQRLLFAELVGSRDAGDADRSKTLGPLPRSERDAIMAA